MCSQVLFSIIKNVGCRSMRMISVITHEAELLIFKAIAKQVFCALSLCASDRAVMGSDYAWNETTL